MDCGVFFIHAGQAAIYLTFRIYLFFVCLLRGPVGLILDLILRNNLGLD